VSRMQAMGRLRAIVSQRLLKFKIICRMMWQHHANSILLNATLDYSLLFYRISLKLIGIRDAWISSRFLRYNLIQIFSTPTVQYSGQ
jgi:hypothetical protein